jgi:beta-mannosidase
VSKEGFFVTNRATYICLASALLSLSLARTCRAQERTHLPIDSGWEFRQSLDDQANTSAATSGVPVPEWRPAKVPGDVHLDLLHNGLIPEPFFRDNESQLQWIENASWEYRTLVTVTSNTLAHQHLEMVFEGLDAACTVYVNGQKLASPDNMFREWRIDVKPVLKAGKNEIRVVFPSPIKAAEQVAAQDPWRPRTHTEAKTYIRKAAYEYGWDWGPRFVTSGIWRPVYLETWDEARIENVFVEQRDLSAEVAHLDVRADIIASHAGPTSIVLEYKQAGRAVRVRREFSLNSGLNQIDLPVEIEHPNLWYPAGYGEQPIYQFDVQLSAGGQPVDSAVVKTGLRKVVLRRDQDKWGRSFEFDVNGIPVFAKGADVIPFDSFPSRVTTAQYRRVLQSAKDANMNMVRLWGGGYYESQEFYDLCDELGIMVWQDMMFGNDWQPGTYEFKQEIEREAEYQMRRLRNHPSVVLWSGNNETELLRDWNGRGQLPADVHEHIWQDYLSEFSGILARTAAQTDPETPYWPSSPSADYEDLSDSYLSGDNHDWSVWHGNSNFSEYEKHHWRFVSEYGFQSFPEMKTIETFTTPEDRTSIFTPVMLAHQKNASGNSIIHDYMLRYYGEPKDFASFLYASQVLQAESVKIGAEHFRRERPRTMGSIFWQLNDCWPVASWSSIDYAGRWKALQYYARRFYAPQLVSPHIENGALAIYVVSDEVQPKHGELRLQVMDFSGKIVMTLNQSVHIDPLSSKVYVRIPLAEIQDSDHAALDLSTIFGNVSLLVDGREVSTNLIYFAPTKQIRLPQAGIEVTLNGSSGGYELGLKSPVLARSVYVSFPTAAAELSDNYVDLLPGHQITIHVASDAGLEELRRQVKVISMVDAFQSPEKAPQ